MVKELSVAIHEAIEALELFLEALQALPFSYSGVFIRLSLVLDTLTLQSVTGCYLPLFTNMWWNARSSSPLFVKFAASAWMLPDK